MSRQDMEEGKYIARATGAVVLGVSKNKGTPFLQFYLTVTEGEQKGVTVRYDGYFTDKTSERVIQSLRYCGWKGEDLGEFADGALRGLDNSEVEIDVEIEDYTNERGEEKSMPKVAWINRKGGFLQVDQAMAPAAAQAFGERMKGLVLKVSSKTKASDGASPTQEKF